MGIPNSSRNETMGVWVLTDRSSKALGDGDDTGTSLWVTDGFTHQLLDALIAEPSHISQELSVAHEVGTQHSGNRKTPKAMADIFKKVILEESGECGGAFCIARWTQTADLA
jgi:hypothetical protein